LIEVECVEKVVEFAVLLSLFESNVVLLKTVERELRLVIDEDFKGLR